MTTATAPMPPPTPIVDAYTWVNARAADAEVSGDEACSPFSLSISQSANSTLKKAAESTPTVSKSVQDALLCAESFAKSQKTKNSSNKTRSERPLRVP